MGAMLQLTFLALVLVLVLVTQTSGQVINLITHLSDNNNWLEAGSVTLTKTDTVTVASVDTFFDPVVYLRYVSTLLYC